jgi:phosphatidylglycerophosphate synthase
MIDRLIIPVQNALLAPSARGLSGLGVTANQVTLAGFGLGVAAFVALAFGGFKLALGLILLNRLADGLDGAVARWQGPTDRGAFFDIACDFLFYALVPLGFALSDPGQNALAAAVLITAFVGTGSSFLAFATIAAKRGMTAGDYPTKGIHYVGGLTEGFETIALFVVMCLWPGAFPFLAYLFATLCLITTFLRWQMGWQTFTTTNTTKRTL